MRFKHEAHKSMSLAEETEKGASPFRPWDGGSAGQHHKISPSMSNDPVTATCNSLGATLASQSAAMLLAAKYQNISESEALASLSRVLALTPTTIPQPSREPEQDEPLALVMPKNFTGSRESCSSSSSSPSNFNDSNLSKSCGRQRNYKNMTRERRIEANARERMRVHTITAAFERLQSVIPTTEEFTKSSSQKLSKLAVIKIATSYISMLSSMADSNSENKESCDLTIQSCVQECLELIRSETKPRRKCD
jgi:atonal protein 8